MTREHLIELLYKIESKHAVPVWKINGVDVWPILKIKLFFYSFESALSKDVRNKNVVETKSKPLARVTHILSSISAYIRFRITKTGTKDLLFSEAGSHYAFYNNEYVNKFFHPVEIWLERQTNDFGTIQKVVFGRYLQKSSYKEKDIIHLDELLAGQKFFTFFSKKQHQKKKQIYLPDVEQVFDYLIANKLAPCQDFKGFLKYLDIMMEEIAAYQKLYAKILDDSRPRMILELCYYSKANFALNVEARKRGIPTLEIMHGGIGPQHAAYAGWEHGIPGDGYNVLPKTIWVWDEVSNNVVSSWISKQSFHSSFVGGQPWIDFMRSETDSYTDYFAGNKKIILYTLQFDTIDDYIYEAIEKCNDEYEWWLRLHPRKMYAKDAIAEKTDLLGITHKINIEAANDLPLPSVQAHAHIHLSEFSGAITEACLLGIPTVILNEVGVENYQAYITTGECQVSTGRNPDHLLELIYESRKMHPKRTSSKIPYSEIFKKVL